MAYQALYRKYRIKNFTEMVGQDHISKTLVNALKTNKVSHAYLFSGPRGTGKTSTAKLLGQALNCTGEEIVCGQCDMCQMIAKNETPDIIEIDAASNNGVDEIRELRDKVKYAPSHGKYKIYIIDETHMLTNQAFNALLKTLEEPPSHVIFILATTEPHKLPLTIISRCQRFDFKKVGKLAIIERLKIVCEQENIQITDEALELISYVSDGGMRDALSLLDQCYSYNVDEITKDVVLSITGSSSQEIIEKLLLNIISGNRSEILKTVTQMSDEGLDLLLLTDNLLTYLRDTIVITSIGGKVKYQNNEFMEKVIETISLDGVFLFVDLLSKMANQMRLITSPKLFLEVNLLQISNEFNGLDYQLTKPKLEQVENTIEEDLESSTKEVKNTEVKDTEVKEESELSSNDQEMKKEYLAYLNEVRINNILALAQKKMLIDIQNQWHKIELHTSELELGGVASILNEGRVRAASADGLIISFRQSVLVSRLMNNLSKPEQFLQKLFNLTVKVVPVTEKEWVKIKDDYVIRLRRGQNYEIVDEKSFETYFNIKNPTPKIVDEAYELFGDSVIVEENNEY